jgi:hypothetical protein
VLSRSLADFSAYGLGARGMLSVRVEVVMLLLLNWFLLGKFIEELDCSTW